MQMFGRSAAGEDPYAIARQQDRDGTADAGGPARNDGPAPRQIGLFGMGIGTVERARFRHGMSPVHVVSRGQPWRRRFRSGACDSVPIGRAAHSSEAKCKSDPIHRTPAAENSIFDLNAGLFGTNCCVHE